MNYTMQDIADHYCMILEHIIRGKSWPEFSLLKSWTFYLLLSYAYYERDESLVTDSQYDGLCKHLLRIGKDTLISKSAWYVKTHYDSDALEAGSGYHLINKVPITIMNIADTLIDKWSPRLSSIREEAGRPPVVRKRVRPSEVVAPRVRTRTRGNLKSVAK